jgi:hypothetical protein
MWIPQDGARRKGGGEGSHALGSASQAPIAAFHPA